MVGSHLFSPGDIHTKRLFVLLCLGLEGVTVVETDPKGRFVYFKVTLSNDRVFCVYTPSGDSTREQLARGCFHEGLQNYMKNKHKGNENKQYLETFIVLCIKLRGVVEIKHRLYRCCFNYALSEIDLLAQNQE